ncbi:MAG TPA: DUF2726 domain-containing protein [Ktedonobacteraceae bacterium]|nr:DUF2726 domain-containing protein [Ktedonobacteraceae bacterium]
MDRRKHILVNSYEVSTEAVLREVAEKYHVRVHSKIRVADALNVERSGINDEEYSYALRAHFDFVITDNQTLSLFAVEFDELHHASDPQTIYRDKLKNTLCTKLGMPLIRINAEFLRRIGTSSVIGWLIDLWFLYESLQKVAEQQATFDEEPFLYFSFYGYDPFISSRAFLVHEYEQGHCLTPFPEELEAVDPNGYTIVLALVKITDTLTIIGKAHCCAFMFPSIPSVGPYELALELAVADVAEKLKSYQHGRYQPQTQADVQIWRNRLSRWKSVIS